MSRERTSELSRVACSAAIVLDNMLQGKDSVKMEDLRYFLELLRGSDNLSNRHTAPFIEALIECGWFDAEETSVIKVIQRIESICISFTAIYQTPTHYQDCHREVLERHKAFCVALGKVALAQNQ